MKFVRSSVSVFLFTVPLVAACSGEDKRPNAYNPGDGSGGRASGGSSNSGGGGSPGSGGDATAGSAGADQGNAGQGNAGQGGAGPVAECGNALAESGEQCDGLDDRGLSCADLGFEVGELTCTSACEFDTSACSGTERCFDGKDNDGDRLVDCADTDCASDCASSCTEPPVLADPANLTGSTTGHSAESAPGCGSNESGPEVVYQFTAGTTGMLDLALATQAELVLEVRDACAPSGAPLACSSLKRLSVPVTQGDELFVVVDGQGSSTSGTYTLTAASRPIECGDSKRDPSEECDDGNKDSSDGCSGACAVESDETEPNATTGQANTYVDPFIGEIGSAGDLDLIKVVLTELAVTFSAFTSDFGDGLCASQRQDSYLRLLNSGGTELAHDDDGGDGWCSRIEMTNLAAGTYYLEVSASEVGETPLFSYLLRVETDLCGNGITSAGEECDDGNVVGGDGCGPRCTDE